jgi:hypothetical protein
VKFCNLIVKFSTSFKGLISMKTVEFREALLEAMNEEMRRDPNIFND